MHSDNDDDLLNTFPAAPPFFHKNATKSKSNIGKTISMNDEHPEITDNENNTVTTVSTIPSSFHENTSEVFSRKFYCYSIFFFFRISLY